VFVVDVFISTRSLSVRAQRVVEGGGEAYAARGASAALATVAGRSTGASATRHVCYFGVVGVWWESVVVGLEVVVVLLIIEAMSRKEEGTGGGLL